MVCTNGPGHKSDMNNSFRIMFIKINIIKVSIIKIYTKNTVFVTRECEVTRIFIKKSISLSWNKALWSFFIIVFVTNQSRTNFNAGRISSKSLSHIFGVFYLSRQNFSIRNSLITHFFSLISIRNKIKYKMTSINSFNTHFLTYRIQERIAL